jgi:tetratricopeptide (TPR) repeat protein
MFAVAGARGAFAAKSETWIEVRSPNFIVLTNANEKQGRRVAFQFETIRALFRELFGVQSSTKDPAVTIIAVKNEDALKLLLPEYWAQKGLARPASYYLPGSHKNYLALRLDVAMRQGAIDYVHFLTRRLFSQLPLWLVEGLAEFYGNTRIEGKKVFVGAPSDPYLLVLRRTPPLPIRTLFAVDASSPYYHEENKVSIFYAESWALTHYLLTRDWREKTYRVTAFVKLLGQNVAAEEAARQTIGDLDRLQNELTKYLGWFAFTPAILSTPAKLDPSDFQAETVSDAESLAVRGDFMAHRGRFQEAQEMLEEALKIDPKLAAAHESMGFVFAEQGKFDKAKKWYSEAVALNSRSCLAHYYYGASLLKGILDEDSAAKAEASLRTAIKIAPDFAPAYDALGWLLLSRHKNLEEAYKMAVNAVNLEPGNVRFRVDAAQTLLAMDRVDDAVRVARLAASMAKTPEEKAQVQTILTSIQQYQDFQRQLKEREQAARKAQAPADQQMSSPAAVVSPHPERPELLATRKTATPPEFAEPSIQLTPSEIEIYKGAQTLIDWTPRQVHDCPFLHKLRPAGSQDQLPMVLERVGETATRLFHNFSEIACDEELSSETELAPAPAPDGGRVFSDPITSRSEDRTYRKFRYIIIPRPVGDSLAFEEYRTDLKGNLLEAPRRGNPIMITANHTSAWLYLSPDDQHVSRFRHFGIQTIRNRECHVVGFAQKPERTRNAGELDIAGRRDVLLVQGVAWIDSQTYQVLRIKTWLLAPRPDIGLDELNSTVDFYPVRPSGFEGVLWLPRDVTVESYYLGMGFHNTHHYSNFKLFRVGTAIKY